MTLLLDNETLTTVLNVCLSFVVLRKGEDGNTEIEDQDDNHLGLFLSPPFPLYIKSVRVGIIMCQTHILSPNLNTPFFIKLLIVSTNT